MCFFLPLLVTLSRSSSYLFRRHYPFQIVIFSQFQSLHEGTESPMTRGSPAGSLSKKHFALNSRSPGESSDRKVSRMQMGNLISLNFYVCKTWRTFLIFQPLIGLPESQATMKIILRVYSRLWRGLRPRPQNNYLVRYPWTENTRPTNPYVFNSNKKEGKLLRA